MSRSGAPLRRFDCAPPELGELVLGRDGGGLRYFLDGQPVPAGVMLEMRVGARWTRVRFETSFSLEPVAWIYEGGSRSYRAIASDRFRWPKLTGGRS